MRPSRSVRSPLAGKHFKNVKRASEHAKGPHCMRLTACLPNRTRAPSGERARTGTLDEPDREGNMAHTRAADDFQTIRARMEELRREREGAAVMETDCINMASVQHSEVVSVIQRNSGQMPALLVALREKNASNGILRY